MLSSQGTTGEREGVGLGCDLWDVTIRSGETQRDDMGRALHTTEEDIPWFKARCVDGETSDGVETVGLGQGLHTTEHDGVADEDNIHTNIQ